MKISHVAILENPVAGSGKSSYVAAFLQKELTGRGVKFHIYKSQWPAVLDEFSDIWLIGGDGTINYFINHYPTCSKPLALFKSGTGNDFAWKLYGNSNLSEQFIRVFTSSPKPVDAGLLNETLFMNCVGVGFDGEIIRSMGTIRFLGGHIGYVCAVLLKILSFKEYHFKIQAKEESWDDPFLLALIVNSSRAGGGFNIAPPASINDGQLDMVLCRKLSVWNRLRYLPVIKRGNHLKLPFVIHRLGEQFELQSSKEMAIQVDGELLYSTKINISIQPGKFLFRY